MKINLKLLLTVLLCALPLAAQETNYSAGQISFTPPENWQNQPVTSSMRLYQFAIPHPDNNAAAGEMTVFYFGPGQGGSVQANIERWQSQFQQAENSPSEQESLTVNNLKVTKVFTQGVYLGMAGMPQAEEPKTDYALLGAIVEGPAGPVFFKLTGPAETVRQAKTDFQSLINSLAEARNDG